MIEDVAGMARPDVVHRFEAVPGASRAARRAVSALFPDGGRLGEDVGLAVSELVANVVLHTRSGGLVQAWDSDPFLLQVSDSNRIVPQVPSVRSGVGGRGLGIVASLSKQWGTRLTSRGKTVWAEFSRSPQRVVTVVRPCVSGIEDFDAFVTSARASSVVLTVEHDGVRGGCLIDMHARSGLEPPSYCVWVATTSHTFALLRKASRFALHIVDDTQGDLAALFGGVSGRDVDKFSQCEWSSGLNGVPLLTACPLRVVLRTRDCWDAAGAHACVTGTPVGEAAFL